MSSALALWLLGHQLSGGEILLLQALPNPRLPVLQLTIHDNYPCICVLRSHASGV